jgi:hypothetical protein
MSSIDCPWHGDFSSESDYKAAFINWCERIGDPSKRVKQSFVNDGPNDLMLEFEDGTEIQVFVSEPTEESWYYCDRVSGKYLIVSGCGVKEETDKSEQSLPADDCDSRG